MRYEAKTTGKLKPPTRVPIRLEMSNSVPLTKVMSITQSREDHEREYSQVTDDTGGDDSVERNHPERSDFVPSSIAEQEKRGDENRHAGKQSEQIAFEVLDSFVALPA